MASKMSINLPKQFVISQSGEVPPGFSRAQFAGWTIGYAPGLPITWLQDGAGQITGIALGWAAHNGRRVDRDGGVFITDCDVESLLEAMAGRFVVLGKRNGAVHLHLDPSGALPAVYCPEQRVIASTTNLVPASPATAPNESLARLLAIPQRDGWYPFGVLPRRGIYRLLPNHVLRLDDFAIERVWPVRDLTNRWSDDPYKLVAAIAESVRDTATAFVRSGTQAHLTAGHDTRMVLACLRDVLHKVEFFTIAAPGARLDCLISQQIANRFKLRYRSLTYYDPDQADLCQWYTRTGSCLSDHVSRLCTTLKHIDLSAVSLTGTAGEVGRSFYWTKRDLGASAPTVENLFARLGIVMHPELAEAAQAWLAPIAHLPAEVVLDLMYIEQRLGCWGGPSAYGSDSQPSISPFNNRSVFLAMLELSPRFRITQGFSRAFVNHLWPELLRFPFNRAVGLDRLRFLRQEVKQVVPSEVKADVKRALSKLPSAKPRVV